MTARLPVMPPDQLDAEQAKLYAEIVRGPRGGDRQLFALVDGAGALTGPFNAMLYAPAVGEALQELGAAVRFRTSLPDRVRELAVLVVAQAWRSDFERYAHERLARAAGLDDAEISALATGRGVQFTDPVEDAAYRTVRALVTRQDLDDAQYGAAVERLGHAALVELSALVGYYATLALQLRIFRVAVPGLDGSGAGDGLADAAVG